MRYVVRKTSYARRPWKVGLVIEEKGKVRELGVPQHTWQELGLHDSMTIEQVKQRVKSLNALEAVKRRTAARHAIDARLDAEREEQHAFLPEIDVAEFERDILFRRNHNPKLKSYWHRAKNLICELKIPVQDWEYRKHAFYDLFRAKQISPSYLHKLLPIMNMWGEFQARKYRQYFQKLPYPKGRERRRIGEAFQKKMPGGRTPRSLDFGMLEEKRTCFKPEQFNWLYVSVAFGLRPEEITHIIEGRHFEVREMDGVTVLAVFQTKLSGLPVEECWKLIPIVCKEQEIALKLIENKALQRPWAKVVSKHLGTNVNLRSGRKNFTSMMLDRGHPLEDISSWLGHRSIQRTWSTYLDREKLRYSKKPTKKSA